MHGPGSLDELCEQVQGDLASRLHGFDGSMLTKFVALTEIIDSEGVRQVVILAQPDMQTHETLGLFDYARAIEWVAVAVDDGRQD